VLVGIEPRRNFNSCASEVNSKVFNSDLSSLNVNYGGCGITVITSGCGPGNEGSFLINGSFLIQILLQLNVYGSCGIMVITSGCGPGNEGSIPSFCPLIEVKNEN
jgi:hypothetical protein